MPICEEHAGRTYPATPPYLVTAVKVQEFATALQDPAALNAGLPVGPVGPTAPKVDPVAPNAAPPTFVAVLAANAWEALFADPDLGLSLARTVHVDQRFDWSRPLLVGESATAQLTIETVKRRGPAAIITVSVSIRVDDAEVATARSTFMHTEGARP